MWTRIREKAEEMEHEVHALVLAYRDARTPWYARAWLALVVAYALSPIDLIPDFIPIVGYLDDIVLIPLGVWAALRMVPAEVMAEARLRAREMAANGDRRSSRWGAAIVVTLWVAALTVVILLVWRRLR